MLLFVVLGWSGSLSMGLGYARVTGGMRFPFLLCFEMFSGWSCGFSSGDESNISILACGGVRLHWSRSTSSQADTTVHLLSLQSASSSLYAPSRLASFSQGCMVFLPLCPDPFCLTPTWRLQCFCVLENDSGLLLAGNIFK